ncbi:HNH endonuclease signature motif containing protein [Sideroxydans sp. CL21]|uniref:HNH endonuclease signature motif containing protein n=1 Tax=Sideroxydans sp. CL21 TaxID=2600596 RepID=UPI0024BC7E5F|nr:HNH endonuclease signature motif containing protein [Sideroxydans sp. CL21]
MIKLSRPACPNPAALAAGNYKHSDNKLALKNASSDKCMYCESKITHIDFGDVEHIKPKADDKFPELAYEWSNLGLVCGKCNNIKTDKFFPDAPFIDPYAEDPKDHLMALGAVVVQRNGSARGEITIQEIDLNRPELLERRYTRVKEVLVALNAAYRTHVDVLKVAALAQINLEAGPDKEYSMIVKALLKANAD